MEKMTDRDPKPDRDIIRTAEIISVGTELLTGQTLNTNTYYLAGQLTLQGVAVYHQTVVGDNPGRLEELVMEAGNRSDLVFLTGGLGPTEDDLTMRIVAESLGYDLELRPEALAQIQRYFTTTGRQMSENNRKQAMLPACAKMLANDNGTAPGAIIPGRETGYFCLLPGPPSELQPMFEAYVRPWLSAKTDKLFDHHFMSLMGIGESTCEEKLKDLIDTQDRVTLATYAAEGEVKLRISEWREKGTPRTREMERIIGEIRSRLSDYIYTEDGRSMTEVIRDLLVARHETIGLAESCTAGLASAKLAELPGISDCLKSSVVTYTNESKVILLGVEEELLARYGAVSRECAVAMAEGARARLEVDLSLAVTGIAGPGGGSPDKPVGLVYIACSYKNQTRVEELRLSGNRQRIREVSCLRVFNLARKCLLADS